MLIKRTRFKHQTSQSHTSCRLVSRLFRFPLQLCIVWGVGISERLFVTCRYFRYNFHPASFNLHFLEHLHSWWPGLAKWCHTTGLTGWKRMWRFSNISHKFPQFQHFLLPKQRNCAGRTPPSLLTMFETNTQLVKTHWVLLYAFLSLIPTQLSVSQVNCGKAHPFLVPHRVLKASLARIRFSEWCYCCTPMVFVKPLQVQRCMELESMWATKKPGLTFHYTGCFNRDPYNGFLQSPHNWVV